MYWDNSHNRLYIHVLSKTQTNTHTHTCTYMHACTYMQHTFTHTHTCTYTYMHIHTHTCTYIHMHINIHAYIYTHTHTHTWTYIQIHAHACTYTVTHSCLQRVQISQWHYIICCNIFNLSHELCLPYLPLPTNTSCPQDTSYPSVNQTNVTFHFTILCCCFCFLFFQNVFSKLHDF